MYVGGFLKLHTYIQRSPITVLAGKNPWASWGRPAFKVYRIDRKRSCAYRAVEAVSRTSVRQLAPYQDQRFHRGNIEIAVAE